MDYFWLEIFHQDLDFRAEVFSFTDVKANTAGAGALWETSRYYLHLGSACVDIF